MLLWVQEHDSHDPAAAGTLDLNTPAGSGYDVKQSLMTVLTVNGS